ncbi:MAG: adenylosuccinate synthase, partial [Mycoplasmataceae bacterium]|nr:adenylosuccinate synthase [Mycoplasmataceae bacterium]
DEGKGKVSDYLAQKADIVVRYQGGNNAGHTIEFDGNRYALRHIPSGVFNPKTKNILAQGMVINPKMLLEEIEDLKEKGITDFQILISDRAHVIMPYHLDLDEALENLKGSIDPNKMIGTTKKGIGPAYEDKAARIGIRYGDFINEEAFKESLKDVLLIKNKVLKAFGLKTYTVDDIFDEYKEYAKILAPLVKETGSLLAKEIEAGKSVVFEGAQGVMLCIENGTYPYVTSSSPTASSIPLGAGINPSYIQNVTGIVKAYTTRVGTGAMPTNIEEKEPEMAQYIRKTGREFGTVTGRPRLIGWLDTVLLKHATRVSGLTDLTVTLLDVLDELDEIKICHEYKLNGEVIDYIPGSNAMYEKCEPQYMVMKGWKTNTTKIKTYNDLPVETKEYLRTIEKLVGVPVTRFSVGPDREQTIDIEK